MGACSERGTVESLFRDFEAAGLRFQSLKV